VRILAVGAHPDDIEIGAGALISKSVALGLDIDLLILTDDIHTAALRQSEAVRAAAELGVPGERVLFGGLLDGSLRADGETVRRIRELVAARNIDPDIVVTHSQADSHNDHVEANRIAHAVFRQRVFLHYSIHLSSELDRFAPRVFVDVSGVRLDRKNRALSMHRSQQSRIERTDLAKHEMMLGGQARLARAEGFEVSFQNNAVDVLTKTIGLSDSLFHRLWAPIVGDAGLTLLYEAYAAPGAAIDWPTVHENAGRDRLRHAFATQWAPTSPLQEKFSNSLGAADNLRRGRVVLAGGAVSNPVVRDLYNRLSGTRWAIEYDLPRTEPAYLVNRADGRRVYPEFSAEHTVRRDAGLIAVVPNPWAPDTRIVCAAGASGFATRLGLEFLADPGERPELAEEFLRHPSTQVAFSVDAGTGQLDILDIHHGGPVQ
jgi:LmbE family N-acetylglucosaminyl deacetylase